MNAIEDLARRDGQVHPSDRPGFVICKAVKTSQLTPHEMGRILDVLAGRICRMAEEEPEFEETAHDLAESCENFTKAEDKRDERLCETTWCEANE